MKWLYVDTLLLRAKNNRSSHNALAIHAAGLQTVWLVKSFLLSEVNYARLSNAKAGGFLRMIFLSQALNPLLPSPSLNICSYEYISVYNSICSRYRSLWILTDKVVFTL